MGRTKKRSKAKSASARTRVKDGQDGAGGTSVKIARRQNETSLAAQLPTKVVERILAELCPSTFGLDDLGNSDDDCIELRALNFALVCKSWRGVGIARYWREVRVHSYALPPARTLAARSAQGLILELSMFVFNDRQKAQWRTRPAEMMAHIGDRLRGLFLIGQSALELLSSSFPPGGLPSLVDFQICIDDAANVDITAAYEAFSHMPRLERFDCIFPYEPGTRTSSSRPRMPAPRRRLTRLGLRCEPETRKSIKHGQLEQEALANLLYVADLSSLRELKLNYNFSHALPAQLAPLLRSLRILRLAAPATLFRSFPAALTSILADLPKLVALDVEICTTDFGRDIGTVSPSDAAALFAALPLSLEVALVEFDFSPPASSAHLSAFLERRLALGVLKRWTSARGTRPDATFKTTWRRYGGGGGEGGEPARWETEDFEESKASPRIV